MDKKYLVIPISILVIAILFVVSAGVNHVNFSEGQPVAPQQNRVIDETETGTPRPFLSITALWLEIFFWGTTILIIITLFNSEEARKKAKSRFLFGVLIGILILAYMNTPPEDETSVLPPINEDVFSSLESSESFTPEAEEYIEVVAPNWVVYSTSAIISLMIAVGIWYLYSTQERGSGVNPIALEAQKAIRDIQAGFNFTDVIKRCYYEMAVALEKEKSIPLENQFTPREYESILIENGLPSQPIHQLTRLFESVRYGNKAPTKKEEIMAVDSLNAIIREVSGSQKRAAV